MTITLVLTLPLALPRVAPLYTAPQTYAELERPRGIGCPIIAAFAYIRVLSFRYASTPTSYTGGCFPHCSPCLYPLQRCIQGGFLICSFYGCLELFVQSAYIYHSTLCPSQYGPPPLTRSHRQDRSPHHGCHGVHTLLPCAYKHLHHQL